MGVSREGGLETLRGKWIYDTRDSFYLLPRTLIPKRNQQQSEWGSISDMRRCSVE